ncbi:PLD nuclease N-terminal domain-containing protein [Phycisphaerales bacterium AB-hyl4]|uniref:PLD nuclease N-terminal domain-containing protein n=1 Tax=Natronomicrosphaera hydrolytica TaxID=3242702 RepID=A0ABV4U9B9_9BACT
MHQPSPDVTVALPLFLMLLMCCVLPVVAGLFAFWLWALIDCVRRDFNGNDKVIWVLVIVLLSWLGALIYLIVGRPQGTMPDRTPPPGARSD